MAVAFSQKLFNFLKKYKLCVIFFWLAAAVCSSFYAMGLMDSTVVIILPPEGYPSQIAYSKMSEYFEELVFSDSEIIVIELKEDKNITNITNPLTERLCADINIGITGINNAMVTELNYYYQYVEQNISQKILINTIQPKFVDSNHKIMLFIITLNVNNVDTETINSFLDNVKSLLNDISSNSKYMHYNLKLTGMMTITEESLIILTNNIESKDLMLLPIMFVFMIYVIGSYKLVILPFLCFGIVVLISFTLFTFAAEYFLTVPPESPSFMLFISMAICVDYGMFLLSRFINNIKLKKLNVNDSVIDTLQFSGHVILLSGSILILLEIGFGLFFPGGGLDTTGYGIALCVFLSILVSISLIPSFILTFPNFFSDIERIPKCIKCAIKFLIAPIKLLINRKELQENNQKLIENENENNNNNIRNEIDEFSSIAKQGSFSGMNHHEYSHDQENQSKIIQNECSFVTKVTKQVSFSENKLIQNEDNIINNENESSAADKANIYFKLAQFVTVNPWKYLCPAFIYLLMSPVLYQLLSWETTMAPTMSFPPDSDSMKAYNTLINNFNPGLMQPIYLLSIAKNMDHTIWNQSYFNGLCEFGDSLIDNGYANNTNLNSFSFIPDPINTDKIKCFQNESDLHLIINDRNINNNPYYKLYLQLFNMTVNTPQSASLIILYPEFDPFTDSAQRNADNLRNFITSYASDNSNKLMESQDLYVHSEMYWQIDLLEMEYNRLPICLLVMLSLIFIIIGIVFKSLFLPIRLLICVVIPIMFVYGFCIGVYVKGWLNWTNIDGYVVLSDSDGLYWPTPILSLSLLLGLALDYEIFLYSRVFEYRSKHNYTTRASIILAVSSTGPVISSAGVVMALAFAGLLLENVVGCGQFGLIFVLGVLVDTFIIRPILVPSILSFADYWNWFPTIMPQENLKNEYHQLINN